LRGVIAENVVVGRAPTSRQLQAIAVPARLTKRPADYSLLNYKGMSLQSHARKTAGASASIAPRRSSLSPARAGAAAAVRLVSEDAHHLTFTWGPLLGTLWKRETHVTAVEALKTILRSLAATVPNKKVGVLTIVAADAPLPSAEARSALVELFHDSAEAVVCSAVVFEGSGFRASAVRSVATGLALLARQPFPHRIFANTRTAFNWTETEMLREVGMPIDVLQLEYDFMRMRSDKPR
jgi:hypothetical protein